MAHAVKAFLGLSLAAFVLSAPAVFAQAPPTRAPALEQFEKAGGKVEFLGSSHGLDGWVVTNAQGGVQYIYTTADDALVAGMLFSPDGTAETPKQIEAFQQKTSVKAEKPAPKSEKLYVEAEKAAWVALGNPQAPYIYVFINVNCDHCQGFLDDIGTSVSGGQIQLRLIPYGAVEINRDAAAALLSVEKPEDAWRAYIGGDKAALGKDKIKDGAYQKVDANTALVKDWKLPGPPLTLYRRPADNALMVVVGRPENKLLLPAEFLNTEGQ